MMKAVIQCDHCERTLCERIAVASEGPTASVVRCACGHELIVENQVEEILQVVHETLTVEGYAC